MCVDNPSCTKNQVTEANPLQHAAVRESCNAHPVVSLDIGFARRAWPQERVPCREASASSGQVVRHLFPGPNPLEPIRYANVP